MLIFEAFKYCNLWKIHCQLLHTFLYFFWPANLYEFGLRIIHFISGIVDIKTVLILEVV